MHVRRGLRGLLPLRGVPRGGHGETAVRRGRGHDTGETSSKLSAALCQGASYVIPAG